MSKPTSTAPSVDDSIKEKPEDIEQGQITEKRDQESETVSPEPVSPWHPSQFPDGGKDAWLCLLGVSPSSTLYTNAPSTDHRLVFLLPLRFLRLAKLHGCLPILLSTTPAPRILSQQYRMDRILRDLRHVFPWPHRRFSL